MDTQRIQPTNRSLSIRISTDGLSFCSYSPTSPQTAKYIVYPVSPVISMAANLKKALTSEPVLRDSYQRINILMSAPQFTTLPTEEFKREQAEDIYRFVFPQQEVCHVSYNILKRSGMAILFGIDRNIHQMLLDDYPRARFYASASTLIEYFGEQSLGGNGRRMYAYLHENRRIGAVELHSQEMSVYCFDQGRVLFTNTYPVRVSSDCLYYIMAVWKQLEYNVLEDTLCLVDDSDMSQDLRQTISPYIRNIQTIDQTDDIVPVAKANNGQHLPYDLHTLLSCGF